MIGKRAVAAVVAVALVVVAFVVRGAIDDDPEASPTTTIAASPDGSDPANPAATEPGEPATTAAPAPTDAPTASALVCIAELEAVCDELATAFPDLDVRVEPAGVTLDRLAALDDPATAPIWLTVDPYPAMVDASRGNAEPVGYATTGAGASQLAVAVPKPSPRPTATPLPETSVSVSAPDSAATVPATTDPGPPPSRATTLQIGCADVALWRCIGDNAGATWTDLGGEASWGTVRPSLGDVPDSALGLASFATAVSGYTGASQLARTDWESDTTFVAWMRRLVRQSERAPDTAGTPLRTMATRASALDVAATADFELAGLGTSGDRFDLVYPQPGMWLQAVVAVPAGVSAPTELTDAVTTALATAGWDAPGTASAPLPSAATMLALRALWEEA